MTPEISVALLATISCGYVDARTGFIPNRITYPTLGIIIVIAAVLHRLDSAALGALCVGGTLALLYTITLGRGMGLGDVKLAACIGAGFGPICGMIALFSSFIAGGIFGAWLLYAGHAGRKTPIRFGPFLAAGSLLALVLQSRILLWL
jgi:prepilin signal peptidase PulO-like enzyme (type II secretory pathway)